MGAFLAAMPWAAPLIASAVGTMADVFTGKSQMRFAERMSSTSWQRGIADMRRAGINPIAAFSQGGASSPVVSLPSPSRSLTEGISNAVMMRAQLAAIKASTEKTEAETEGLRQGQELVRIYGGPKAEAERGKLEAERDRAVSETEMNRLVKKAASAREQYRLEGEKFGERGYKALNAFFDSLEKGETLESAWNAVLAFGVGVAKHIMELLPELFREKVRSSAKEMLP